MLHAGALLGDDGRPPGEQRRHVDARLTEHDAELGGAAGGAQTLDGGHHGLGRDAAPVQAGAAQLARLDERHARAELGGAQRRHVARRTAAQHHDARHRRVASLIVSIVRAHAVGSARGGAVARD